MSAINYYGDPGTTPTASTAPTFGNWTTAPDYTVVSGASLAPKPLSKSQLASAMSAIAQQINTASTGGDGDLQALLRQRAVLMQQQTEMERGQRDENTGELILSKLPTGYMTLDANGNSVQAAQLNTGYVSNDVAAQQAQRQQITNQQAAYQANPPVPPGMQSGQSGQLGQPGQSGGAGTTTGGTTSTGGTIGSGSNTPWDTTTARQNLIAKYGADVVSQLDDNQIQYLGMGLQASQLMAQNDQKTDLAGMTTDSLNGLLTSAAAYIDPRYQDQWNTYKSDALQSFAQATGDAQYLEQQQKQQFQQQGQDLAAQMAEAGLAQSGIRAKAQQQLQTQQQGVVSSSRRQLQQQLYQLGSQAEKQYGAAGAGLVGPVSYMGQAATYNPIGVKYASAPEQKNADITNMAQGIYSQPQLNVPAAPKIQ